MTFNDLSINMRTLHGAPVDMIDMPGSQALQSLA